MLISTSELNSIIDNSDVIIADTRSFKEYSEAHIPRAVHLTYLHFIGLIQQKMELRISMNKQENYFHFLVLHQRKKSSFMILYLVCLQQEVFGC